MAEFIAWLKDEAEGGDVLEIVWQIIISKMLFAFLAVIIMEKILGLDVPPVVSGTMPILSWNFPLILTAFVFLEEIIFRVIPLMLAIGLQGSPKTVLFVAGISSVLFGLVHGSWHHVFIQGAGGMFLSCVFLKCGGFNKKYFKATAASTATHFLFNGLLITFALIAGERYF